jgi:hypothetical protein
VLEFWPIKTLPRLPEIRVVKIAIKERTFIVE